MGSLCDVICKRSTIPKLSQLVILNEVKDPRISLSHSPTQGHSLNAAQRLERAG
jgi:hypothetical protein